MSRQTPRRNRPNHNRQPSGGPRIAQASDYESDATHYLENRGNSVPKHFHRTNTELNLGVLKRYVPSINSIIAIAANAVIYTFAMETKSWDRSGVEGTLFVCSKEPSPLTGEPRFCVFVLNRRGLDNLMLDLATVRDCDLSSELLMMNLENAEGDTDSEEKVIGVWMHADNTDTRQVNMKMIHGLWEQVKEARKQVQNLHVSEFHEDINPPGLTREPSVGPAVQAMGKPLSIGELFASQGGGGGSLGGLGG